MVKPSDRIEEVLICLTGFVIGAIVMAAFTGTPDPAQFEPAGIERPFEASETDHRSGVQKLLRPGLDPEVLQ